jgi:hypothetical protein
VPRFALAMSVNSAFALLALLTRCACALCCSARKEKLNAGMVVVVADVVIGKAEVEIKGVAEEERVAG